MNSLAKSSFSCQRVRTTGLQGRLFQSIPRPLRQGLKRSAGLCLHGLDLLFGAQKELIPPRYLNFAGDGDFAKTGDEFLAYFRQLSGLLPEHNVLEVGCGIGRMARPLTKYLTTGTYDGIDIVPGGVRWCQKNYMKYPNFRFQLADVKNPEYHQQGRLSAAEYRFPFNDEAFDFIYLTSVFTHMLRRDTQHYLDEISRTLRPGGVCFITYFLRNEESLDLMSTGHSSLAFRFPQEGCWTSDARIAEDAVAYDESALQNLYEHSKLSIEGIHYGAWCGRSNYLSFQDIVIARKLAQRANSQGRPNP